jgi:hypothetical protein
MPDGTVDHLGSGGAPVDGGATGFGGATGIGGVTGTGDAGTCTNTASDAANCGICGHSCLGGKCAAGICQPLLLGTVPNTSEYAHKSAVSGGKIYVFTGTGQNPPSSVWQVDASTPGTPTEITTSGTVSCVMNGQLFWTTSDQGAVGMDACTISNCAATTTPIVTLSSGRFFGMPPGCDAANNEVVWTSTADSYTYTINRASPTGANIRDITSFYLIDNEWHFVGNGDFPGETDRIFYDRYDFASGTDFLYYISTSVVNAASVQVAKVENIGIGFPMTNPPLDLANDTVLLASEYSSSTMAYEIFSIPLPNGTLLGTPPVFTSGYISGGVLDQMTFYGTVWANPNIPQDAVIKCPLSDCSSPTIVARGQAMANNFAQDGVAVYWTTTGQASNVAIWKVAK